MKNKLLKEVFKIVLGIGILLILGSIIYLWIDFHDSGLNFFTVTQQSILNHNYEYQFLVLIKIYGLICFLVGTWYGIKFFEEKYHSYGIPFFIGTLYWLIYKIFIMDSIDVIFTKVTLHVLIGLPALWGAVLGFLFLSFKSFYNIKKKYFSQ